MMNSYPRPDVTPERRRELEILAMQILIQLPQDLGECLLVRDLCDKSVEGWISDASRGPSNEA